MDTVMQRKGPGRYVSALFGAVALLAACSSSKQDRREDGGVDVPDQDGGQESGLRNQLVWSACSLVPGEDDGSAECAEAVLPLDHSESASPDFPLRVKRRPARGKPNAQLWLLHGGPGDSALDDMATLAGSIGRRRDDLELLAIDHRGVGESRRLDCPTSHAPSSPGGEAVLEEEWDACVDEIKTLHADVLPFLNVTQSARDLGALVAALARPGAPVFIFGGSYGTYLAQRYLQLFPQQPSGVILEGVASVRAPIAGYDAAMNAVGQDLMDTCASTPACRAHFTEDPWAVAQRTVAALDQSRCAGLDTASARAFLGSLLTYAPTQELIPALIHRLDRCSADDVARVSTLVDTLGALNVQPAGEARGQSDWLGMHIVLSELIEGSADLGSLETALSTYTMATGIETTMARMGSRWPVYPHDSYYQKWSSYRGPMLMLQGEMDPASTVEGARMVRDHYTAPRQTYVELPAGAHQVTGYTPTNTGADCAEAIYLQFLEDPEASLDTRCSSDLAPRNFDGTPETATYLFGTRDVWGD